MKKLRNKSRYYLEKAARRLSTGSDLVSTLGKKIYVSPEEIEVNERKQREVKWYQDKGDATHRVTYDLAEDSIVFDLGGYHGDWAADIFCRYGSRLFVFEPVAEFKKIIDQRFLKNPKVKTFQFGLGAKNQRVKIFLAEGGTSIVKEADQSLTIKIVKAVDFFKRHKITKIDLIKINIEGAEFELLEYLLDIGYLKNITDLQIQFHIFAPDAVRRRQKIRRHLRKTHHLTYEYPWVWENWSLNKR